MKRYFIFSCLILFGFNIYAQVTGYSQKQYISIVNQTGIKEKVENYVNSEIEIWQQKGRYEKLADYQLRVTEDTRNKKIE